MTTTTIYKQENLPENQNENPNKKTPEDKTQIT